MSSNHITTPFSDEYFMKQAMLEAYKAFDKDEIPVGAVITSNNRIIARSHNLTEQLNDVTAHAEIQAITSAANFLGGKYLKDCTLYVTLEPCNMCAGALAWAQITKIVYAAGDDKRGFTKFSPSPLHPRTKVLSGILKDESVELIKSFFSKKRN